MNLAFVATYIYKHVVSTPYNIALQGVVYGLDVTSLK